jgi:transposase
LQAPDVLVWPYSFMPASPLLPDPAELRLDHVISESQSITIVVATARPTASCPACQRPSARVHSRYVRSLADLPWSGTTVRLRLHTRRFFCSSLTCSRRIFTERLPRTAARYARRTTRLTEALQLMGLALGGEAGARLAARLGMAVSGDTLLRRIRQLTAADPPAPRVLGVDDWAWKRGHRYGTILVDLERHAAIDLLPDREAVSLERWLQAHPGVEVISRDRNNAYAEGATKGAPKAVQVADRWHLLKNLGEALERILQSQHQHLQQAAQTAAVQTAVAVPETPAPHEVTPKPLPPAQHQKHRSRERRLARYEQVKTLHQQGWSQRAISLQTGLERKTIRRYLRAGAFREWATPQRHRALDRFLPYLKQRWAEGCHNAAQLWREIRQQGYPGRPGMIRQWASRLRAKGLARSPGMTPATRKHVPTPRQVAWWLLRPEEQNAEECRFLAALWEQAPEVKHAAEAAREFTRLVRERDAKAWPVWQQTAAQTLLAPFVRQLQRDEAAVQAALTHPWSNGQTEGQVHRLKLIKRQMFGRAKFDLLKKRVLYQAA